MEETTWPSWLPKGVRRSVKLTDEQLNYIRPAFYQCRGDKAGPFLDNVILCNGTISGHKLAIAEFLKRFQYSDFDLSNLIQAAK